MQGHAEYCGLRENPEAATLATSGKTLVRASNTMEQLVPSGAQRCTAVQKCEVCEGEAEDKRANREVRDETGMTVCKACIDEALCLMCASPPLARLISRIVTERCHG